jgi:hypothetical protein
MESQNTTAVKSLLLDRKRLLMGKAAAIVRFDTDIQALEAAIETLAGQRVWEIGPEPIYDDEHPDYIRGSVED